ncbi:type IV pilus secretin PilQ [Paucibacter sp. APW11]|uniref:Type IV pilus secretin PilQ n=1 Tax=Roseateles aquae TaxID=3077235 RepID=A0ABU3P507_9BURK|nr:type IV pilus secretin PilQ [Paucibacter sp. APW11]MDT8997653.1 type IV pilus secretin PilQ [Paucibacter sp. APW11]
MAAGAYEHGLRGLEEGLRQHPESVALRSGLVQARTEVALKLLSQAEAQLQAKQLDEAQRTLERADALDPGNARVRSLLAGLLVERRQSQALDEAQAQLARKQPEQALRTIASALKDNSRHAGLLALQHRIEGESRQQQLRQQLGGLAESRPISLDFRDASLRTVLDVVTRNSGINFILDKDIRPDARVTVFLRGARVEDALDLIIGTNQLAKKVIDDKTVLVYPNTPDKQREYQEQVLRVFYIASADAKGAAAFLKAMLKIRDPFVDERTNMVALRESPENIQLAERLIALYDAGEPEVLLDVEVLEVSSNRLSELGVALPNAFSLTALPPAGQANLTLGNVRDLTRDRITLGVGSATVHLRREVGDFTTLANPKIRARSKEKAKIMIGDKIPVVSATTGQAGFVADTVSYIDVGLKLEVEPTVYANDEVAMRIALEVSTLGTATKTQSGTLAYQIGTRNASTLLRLRDNETQLLAGLISKDEGSSATRVPGLGDLPALGRLFSNTTDTTKRTELVLAITPHVLRNIRQPDASETELWVGTDQMPRMRPIGGLGGQRATAPESATALAPAPMAAQPLAAEAGAASAVSTLQYRWIAPTEIRQGEVFDVQLLQDGNESLRGAMLELSFAPDKLQLLEATEGEFYKQDGAATSVSRAGGEGKDGHLRFGVMRNSATGMAGKGTALRLRFKALAAGAAELRLDAARPLLLRATELAPQLPAALTLQVR